MKLIIKTGSVTNAQRSMRLLRSSGYKAQVKRIESPTKDDGCGYSVEVMADDETPVHILHKNGIAVRGVERIDIS